MNTHRTNLILKEANLRLSDAVKLEELNSCEGSDTAYLLKLLAFELFLKHRFEINLKRHAPKNHEYHNIFSSLNEATQNNLIVLAGERIGPSGLSKSHLQILKIWGINFISMRYPYDSYGDMTEKEYRTVGQQWANDGFKIETAKFQYHPEELTGMLYALKHITEHAA